MNHFLNQFNNNDRITVDKNNIFLYPWSFAQGTSLSLVIKNFAESEIENFNIYVSAAEEFEIGANFEKHINRSIAKKFLEKNLKIYFIFGSQNLKFYEQHDFLYHAPHFNMHVQLWPTYWFNRTLNSSKCAYLKEKLTYSKNTISYPFISLNNVGKYHRCLLIDLLSKNNMLDQGAVTWYDFCVDTTYSWNWITSQTAKRQLSDSKEYLEDNYKKQFTPPPEFFQSFMSIVSETTDRTIFITEKTSMVLLLKQPFLVQGAPGFHLYLKELGFKLYDEIFDYSFDSVVDLHTRTEMLIDNVKSILHSDFSELYKLIEPKLEYNQRKFFEIVNNTNLFPSIVHDNPVLKTQYNFNSIIYDL